MRFKTPKSNILKTLVRHADCSNTMPRAMTKFFSKRFKYFFTRIAWEIVRYWQNVIFLCPFWPQPIHCISKLINLPQIVFPFLTIIATPLFSSETLPTTILPSTFFLHYSITKQKLPVQNLHISVFPFKGNRSKYKHFTVDFKYLHPIKTDTHTLIKH